MKKTLLIFLTAIPLLLPRIILAQETTPDTSELLDMSLEELFDMNVSVASTKAMSQRESPGIVSVITSEEIQMSGSRDLIDILRLVPGIDFGVDVQGVVGISMRGNWAHDGKVLMMIDGLEINELAFSTLQFGNHYSVDQIKRIELIRGPGSSIYGGNAEFGVINIITHGGEDLSGIKVTGTYGQMAETYARRNVNISAGKKINDFAFNLHGFFGQGNRSDQIFTDIYGDEFDLSKGGSELNPSSINVGLSYKGLSTRVVYDYYYNKSASLYDAGLDPLTEYTFKNLVTEVKYDWELSEKLTITPKFNYIQQKPWNSHDELYYPYDLTVKKMRGNVIASYDVNDQVNFVFGGEYLGNHGLYNDNLFYNGTNEFSYQNASAFVQGLFQTKYANITIGGRYDYHSEVEAAFSPRIAVTKAFDKFHFKFLYSHAFRTPGFENMNLAHNVLVNPPVPIAPEIKPEKTIVSELELGYNINKSMLISANLYNIVNKDPIVYFFYYDDVTEGEAEGYFNDTKTGSRGVELEYKIRNKWGYVNVNYSFYSTKGLNEVALFEVPVDDHSLLAFPQHKITLNSNFKITESLNFSPSFIYRTQRYTYRSLDVDEVEILSKEDPIFLFNLYLTYNDLFTEGLTLGAGVYDVFNQKDEFLQPYNMWHAPWPGPSREFMVKLSYHLKMD